MVRGKYTEVLSALARAVKSAFQNPNRVEGASRERPIFGEYFCVRAVYSSALDAYSKVLKRALKKHRRQSITRELQDTCLRRRCVDDDQLASLQKHSVLTKDGENQQ